MNVDQSPLVQMAEEAKRPTRWWLAWIVVTAILVVVRPLGLFIGTSVLGDPAASDPWFPYVEAFGSLLCLLALLAWVKVKEGRPFTSLGFRPRRDALRLLLGLGIGGALISVAVVVGLLTGLYADGHSTHTHSGAEVIPSLLPLILLCLLQGTSQQALTRGYLFQMSARQLPVGVAVVATSALVTVLQTFNPISMLNAVLFAIFATLVALHQGSLWLVVGIQAGWTFFQLDVFGLPAGGIPDPTALWSIGPAPGGAADISGGSFGFDTGLLATVVLVAAVGVAYLKLRRASQIPPEPVPTDATLDHSPERETAHVTNSS